MSNYVWSEGNKEVEFRRLEFLAKSYDPTSIRRLEALPVRAGWNCLEVGAGSGSMARWLCERVGPDGRVLAIDLETRYLDALDIPNLAVRRLDIATETAEPASFDFVHTRAVLVHIPEYKQAVRNMVSALKPGGWLLLEEPDVVSLASAAHDPADTDAMARTIDAIVQVHLAAGADPYLGKRLPTIFGELDLTDIAVEGSALVSRGDSAHARCLALSVTKIQDKLAATGRVSKPEVERFLALMDDPDHWFMDCVLVGACARKPGG